MTKPCYELRLRNSGMFSIVNEVIHYLHLAQTNDYEFFVDWRHSCYLDKSYKGDPWSYYFKPCFPNAQRSPESSLLPVGKSIACAKDNVITPRNVDGQCKPLLMPRDRNIPNQLIKKYLHLQPYIVKVIDAFVEDNFNQQTIGLHLRGLGRDHGGAGQLRAEGNSGNQIDYERFFAPVNQMLVKNPDAKIFACSDSQVVIDHIKSVYGEKVISYEATRSEFGEMHANHPKNQGLTFSPYKLGLDIVIEAYLLARTDYFIHGNSNVANFVVSLNAQLDSCYVYQDISHG